MTAHTPGPWTFTPEAAKRYITAPITPAFLAYKPGIMGDRRHATAQLICQVMVKGRPKKSTHADGALIAAAPDMYEVLENITNQSLWSLTDVDGPGAHQLAQQLAEIRRLAEAAIAKAERSPLPGDAS